MTNYAIVAIDSHLNAEVILMLPITTLFLSLLIPLFFILSINTIRHRRRLQQPLSSGADNSALRSAVRAQANFAEYVPLSMIGMAILEVQGYEMTVWVAGILLLTGRVAHALSLLKLEPCYNIFMGRVIGMVMTFFSLLIFPASYLRDIIF